MDKQNQTTERKVSSSGGGSLLAGLMLGGLVGAGAMLLLAPQSGKRTRQEIQSGAIDLRDRTRERVASTLSEARSRAEDVAHDIRDTADQIEDQGKDIAIEQLDRLAAAAQARKKALQSSRQNSGS
jgi:gas vesicle protein